MRVYLEMTAGVKECMLLVQDELVNVRAGNEETEDIETACTFIEDAVEMLGFSDIIKGFSSLVDEAQLGFSLRGCYREDLYDIALEVLSMLRIERHRCNDKVWLFNEAIELLNKLYCRLTAVYVSVWVKC